MSIFAEAIFLLRAIEAHLLGERESSMPIVANFQRSILYPIKFLRLGMSETTRSASAWALWTFPLLVVGLWVISNSGIAKTEAALWVINACLFIPMPLVAFAVPSMYGANGISQDSIGFVTHQLQLRGFKDTKDLELLKKSIKPFEERARSRVTIFRLMAGLLWAGFMYTVSKIFEIPPTTLEQFLPNALTCVFLSLVVAAAYLAIWSYEASLDKLFRLVEFGCNDFAHGIEKRPAAVG